MIFLYFKKINRHLASISQIMGGVVIGWVLCFAAWAAQPQKFLTFAYRLSPAMVAAHANQYVFVWGVSPALVPVFHEHSPGTLLSTYFPYSRDPNAKHDLTYWRRLHPEWIAYGCDGKPRMLFGDPNIPLDITNSDVIDWQIKNFLHLPHGVDTVALDNYQLRNHGSVCGKMDAYGNLVKRYSGALDDRTFAADAVHWLETVSVALHSHDVKVVINHIPDLGIDGDDPDDPLVARMVNATDGILDEAAESALYNARKATLLSKFAGYVAAHGKWMYFIYRLKNMDQSAVETAVAHYLTLAGPKTAIFVSGRDKAYGQEPNFAGFDKSVGDPCGAAIVRNGAVFRAYEKGLAVFAPPGSSDVSIAIPSGYWTVDGAPAGDALTLSVAHGRVLYLPKNAGSGCSKRL